MEQLSCVEDRLAIQELNQRYATHVALHEIDVWVELFKVVVSSFYARCERLDAPEA